jgi:hypothetical protein
MNDSQNEERIKLKLDSESDYLEYYGKLANKENEFDLVSTIKKNFMKDQESINTSISDQFIKKSRTQQFSNFSSKPRNDSQEGRNRNLQNYKSNSSNYNHINIVDVHEKENKETRSKFTDSLANTTEKEGKDRDKPRVESQESSNDENEYKCQKCRCLFDDKQHLPLCLPSGHFFCKQ